MPSEALAIAVATEWDSQRDTVKFYTMHLVTHSPRAALGTPGVGGLGGLLPARPAPQGLAPHAAAL